MDNQSWRKNGLWPIHLQPQKGELLSSWIVRLAHANGYKVETFCTLVFGYRSTIWNRDIDVLSPRSVLKVLETITGTSEEKTKNTTLQTLEGELFEKTNTTGTNKWILSLGIKHRSRTLRGLMYCPECLATDKEPYFRRKWRLSFMTVCTLHKIHLHDCCPQCQSAIAPHRVDMVNRSMLTHSELLTRCWKCGYNLKLASRRRCENVDMVKFQFLLEDILVRGWCVWAKNKSMYSLVFFEGLYQLTTGMLSIRNRRKIEDVCIAGKGLQLEKLKIEYRHELFSYMKVLMEQWPDNFMRQVEHCGFRYSDLKRDTDILIYWYELVLKFNVKSKSHWVSDEEKRSIVNVLESRKSYFTNKDFKKLSGKYVSEYVQSIRLYKIDDSVYNELLVSIDHEVASTLKIRERSILIRDKIMFSLGRVYKLSISELAKLNIEDVSLPNEGDVVINFSVNATTNSEINGWIYWYINNIRNTIAIPENENGLFVSMLTKKRIKKNAISSRFNRAVKYAGLCREIRSYSDWC